MKKPKIEQFTVGFDAFDEADGESVGVKEILNFKDLSYGLFLNGKLKKTRFLTVDEALSKFGYLSEEVKQKILKHDNRV